MNKKVSTIISILAICAVIAAAYTFYTKNKAQNQVTPPVQTKASDQAGQTGQTGQTGQGSQALQSSNPKVPDFALKDLDGKTVRLSDYRGKVVILNFWAVWCKYCKLEMPDLNELNQELEKDNKAVILAVNVEESPNTIRNYLSSANINLKVLLDQDGSVSQTYGASGLPTTFIINADGTLYTYIPGATDKETLKKILNEINK